MLGKELFFYPTQQECSKVAAHISYLKQYLVYTPQTPGCHF